MLFGLTPTALALSLFFSLVGIAYFRYGKKHNAYFMISGIALMVYPYFIYSSWPLFLIGAALTALPFILDKFDLF